MITHNKINTISDGSDTDLVRPSDWNDGHVIPKIASDNLRNSHDAEASTNSATYVKLKTITLNQKLYGTVRILFDIKTQYGAGDYARGKIYHNGVALGTEQTGTTSSYVTKSEDITHDFEKNDTIELWVKNTASVTSSVRYFRLYYDNEDITTISTSNS